MNDHASFSSNPFPDGRLVALNTMAKDGGAVALCLMGKCTMPHSNIGKSKEDHGRVLRYVHKHYTKACLSVYHLNSFDWFADPQFGEFGLCSNFRML